MPKDKINYRATGPRTVLTRQTVQGRANNGGLRVGEMDRDCIIAHGLNYFLNESMMVRGDEFYMAICNKSGTVAIYNERNNLFLSPFVDGPVKFVTNINNEMNIKNVSKFGKDFSVVRVPYAFKLLMQELQAMNVQMRIITEDNVDRLTSLKEGENIVKISGYNNLEEISNENKKQKLDSDKNDYFKDTTILVEQEPVPVLPDNFMGYADDGDWDQQDQIYKMPVDAFESNMESVEMISLAMKTVKVGEKVQITSSTNMGEIMDDVYNVVEILQNKNDIFIYRIKLENDKDGSSMFITNINEIVKIENFSPKSPSYDFNSPKLSYSPKSPSYDPVSPKVPSVEDDNPLEVQPKSTSFGFDKPNISVETSESASPWMDMEGNIKDDYSVLSNKSVNKEKELVEDDYEDEEDEEEKKEKITIINDGDIDNKDLEILTPPNLNKEGEETNDNESGDSGVKKGIKIDV